MKFIQAIGLMTLVGTVIAAPTRSERQVARVARRAARIQHNRPIAPDTRNLANIIEIEANTTHAQYSSNWAGAVVISTGITSVSGTFIVPSDKSDSSSGSSASAWVGIDGDTCGAGSYHLVPTCPFYIALYRWLTVYSHLANRNRFHLQRRKDELRCLVRVVPRLCLRLQWHFFFCWR